MLIVMMYFVASCSLKAQVYTIKAPLVRTIPPTLLYAIVSLLIVVTQMLPLYTFNPLLFYVQVASDIFHECLPNSRKVHLTALELSFHELRNHSY